MKRKLPFKPSFHWPRVENDPYCKIFSVKLDWCGKILKITFKQVGLNLFCVEFCHEKHKADYCKAYFHSQANRISFQIPRLIFTH